MAMKCEAIVPEVEIEFPCVMENSAGCRLLVINEDIAIPDDGPVVTNFRQLREVYRPCPPGSKFVIQLTADGTFPRAERCDQGTDFVIQHEPNVSIVMPHKGPWSNRVSGEIHNDCACMFPLPNGTKTTITFCDGKWTCEIKEPEPRKEVSMEEAVQRLVNSDERLGATIGDGEINTTVTCKGNDLVMEGDVYISFGRLPDITFYELPTEPQPTPSPLRRRNQTGCRWRSLDCE